MTLGIGSKLSTSERADERHVADGGGANDGDYGWQRKKREHRTQNV